MSSVVVYENGEIELKVSVKNESIWLTQKQISILFEKDIRTINDHIKGIYKEDELFEDATIRKCRIVQKEGDREVLHYNFIISNKYYDRFLIVDDKEVHHIGASLKDLGKKFLVSPK